MSFLCTLKIPQKGLVPISVLRLGHVGHKEPA